MSCRGMDVTFDGSRQHTPRDVIARRTSLSRSRRDDRLITALIFHLECVRAPGKRHFVEQDAMQPLIEIMGGDDAIDQLRHALLERGRSVAFIRDGYGREHGVEVA